MARKSIRVKKANPQTPAVPVEYTLESITPSFTVTALAAQIPAEGFTPEVGFTVTGSFVDDGDIVITKSGGGLGVGPTSGLQWYTQFAGSPGDAELLPTDHPEIVGSASSYGTAQITNTQRGWTSEALSKGSAMVCRRGSFGTPISAGGSFRIAVGAQVRSAFVSHNSFTPTGGFVGNIPGVNGFSADSCWKHVWLLADADDSVNAYDWTTSQYSGSGNFPNGGGNSPAGGDYNNPNGRWANGYTDSAAKYKFDKWMLWQTWFDEPDAPYFDVAIPTFGRFTVQNTQHNQVYRATGYAFHATDPLQESWFSHVNAPGYVRSNTSDFNGDNALLLYDDLYMAFGPGCAARVEIHDTEAEEATLVSVCPVLASDWTDGQLTLKLRANKYMASFSGLWLKIYNAANEHIVVGQFT